MGYKEIISLISKALNPSEAIQVQQFISELQTKNAELTSKIMELEAQIANYNRWEDEKQKYEITGLSPRGAFVYKLKGTTQLFCPVCFDKDKVPVHIQPHLLMKDRLTCPNCKNTYYIPKEKKR